VENEPTATRALHGRKTLLILDGGELAGFHKRPTLQAYNLFRMNFFICHRVETRVNRNVDRVFESGRRDSCFGNFEFADVTTVQKWNCRQRKRAERSWNS
jgi:hypothetical protein